MNKNAPLDVTTLKSIVGGAGRRQGALMSDLLIVDTENGPEVFAAPNGAEDTKLAAPKLDGALTRADAQLNTGEPVLDLQHYYGQKLRATFHLD